MPDIQNMYLRLARAEAQAAYERDNTYEAIEKKLAAAIEAKNETDAAEAARALRNKLLDDTDKEMVSDRIETRDYEKVSAWKQYRQTLRKVPEQEGFPFEIAWPEKPE